ncbi:hypothetical protein [Nocardia sp. NPDC051570]|uniref:hypothetical protein n=1 Tax=Nocardia sp. NPDC051570 TaxID=3364324 RepID=UPI003799AFBC
MTAAAQPPRDIDAVCADLVAALAADGAPAAVSAVVRVVAARTGRTIELRPVSLGGTEVFGLWVALADHDLILYDRTATAAHRNHIVQHELGHIVLEHRPLAPQPPAETADGWANSMCRSDFQDPIEEEAELFARRLTWRLARYSATAASSGVARRITDTLTGGG